MMGALCGVVPPPAAKVTFRRIIVTHLTLADEITEVPVFPAAPPPLAAPFVPPLPTNRKHTKPSNSAPTSLNHRKLLLQRKIRFRFPPSHQNSTVSLSRPSLPPSLVQPPAAASFSSEAVCSLAPASC